MKKFFNIKAFLLAFALVMMFGAIGVAAEGDPDPDPAPAAVAWEFNAAADTITFTGNDTWYVVLKDDKATTVKKTAFKKATKGTAIGISAKDGMNVALDKNLYVFAVTAEPKDGSVTANVTIPFNTAAKIDKVSINYGGFTATDGNLTNDMFTASYKDASKASKDISASNLRLKAKAAADGGIGTESYVAITSVTKVAFYNSMVKKSTLLINVAGTDAKSSDDDPKPMRRSTDKALALAQPAKAPNVKVNVKSGTIAVKNGMDYIVATVEPANAAAIWANEAGSWTSILPYNKDGKAADASTKMLISEKKLNTISFPEFASKFIKSDAEKSITGNEKSFTSIKVTGLDCVADAKKYWIVRTSSNGVKPASDAAVIVLDAQAAAPVIANKESKEYYTDAARTVGQKADLIIPTVTVASADPVKGLEKIEFEYAIVNYADWKANKIVPESIKWTKFVEGKKISSIAVSKYYYVSDVDNYKEFGVKLAAKDGIPFCLDGAVLLVRRAGYEKKNADKTVTYYVPSDFLETELTHTDELFKWGAKAKEN